MTGRSIRLAIAMALFCQGLLALVPGQGLGWAPPRTAACSRRLAPPLLLDDSAAQWYADQAQHRGIADAWQGSDVWSAELSGPAELAGMPWSTPASAELPFEVDSQQAAAEVAALVEADRTARMRQCELEMIDSEEYVLVSAGG
jgi:hypothetical protein